mmetsp:Transcript_31428/g.71413  ORF Transcript_31428/g.71413 Transcript_31428/m.71413 type:complete len:256 (+) Transcript_31428:347-1114(+)
MVSISPPMRRSIHSFMDTWQPGGRSPCLTSFTFASLPASVNVGKQSEDQFPMKSRSAARKSSSAGLSSLSGRLLKKASRASRCDSKRSLSSSFLNTGGSAESRASLGGGSRPASRPRPLPPRSSSLTGRFGRAWRPSGVRCMAIWPLGSSDSSISAPMRRSIHSFRAIFRLPLVRRGALAAATALSVPALDRMAVSPGRTPARKFIRAALIRSSAAVKESSGRRAKNCSTWASRASLSSFATSGSLTICWPVLAV